MKAWPILAATVVLAGCAASAPPRETSASPARAGLGQTVALDGLRVTPLRVIEDSRCAKGVQCVWAGRVRIGARLDLGARTEVRDLELGKPIAVAAGALELVEVLPDRVADRAILPEDYQFGFRFTGGG